MSARVAVALVALEETMASCDVELTIDYTGDERDKVIEAVRRF